MSGGLGIPKGPLGSPQVQEPLPGGGAKPWIIMVIVVLILGYGLWILMGEKEAPAALPDPIAEEAEEPDKKKSELPEPEKEEIVVETAERPEMRNIVQLSSEKRDQFKRHLGSWVRMHGEILSGEKNGDLVFKDPAGLRGKLLKGTAEYLPGQKVKVIGWLVSEELLQIDGLFDIEAIEAVDLLPKKEVYTRADGEQLKALRSTNATFEGKVISIGLSWNKENHFIVFEGSDYEIYGCGNIASLKEDGVTEETLKKELVGKVIRLKGRLEIWKVKEKERVVILFREKDAYEVVE